MTAFGVQNFGFHESIILLIGMRRRKKTLVVPAIFLGTLLIDVLSFHFEFGYSWHATTAFEVSAGMLHLKHVNSNATVRLALPKHGWFFDGISFFGSSFDYIRNWKPIIVSNNRYLTSGYISYWTVNIPLLWLSLSALIISIIQQILPIRNSQECRKCEYNLAGNTLGICPECGTPIPPNQRISCVNSVSTNPQNERNTSVTPP